MWKSLDHGEKVHLGNKVRYTGIYPKAFFDILFEVVKTEQYYFEVICESNSDRVNIQNDLRRKVIKYFDIGNYINLEVWRME